MRAARFGLAAFEGLRARRNLWRGLGMLTGLLLFVSLLIASLSTLRTLELDPEPESLLICAALVPLSMVFAIARFMVLAKSVNTSASWRNSTRVVVFGGLANLLPLPGALAVRMHFLSSRIGYRRSSLASLMSVGIWISTTALFAFALVGRRADPVLTVFLLLVAVASSIVVYATARAAEAPVPHVAALYLLQSLQTVVNMGRAMLIGAAIGLVLPWSAASMLSLSGAAGASTGILPAGLGLSELLSGVAMGVSGYTPAMGVAIAALNRLFDWFGLLVFLPFTNADMKARS